MEPNNKPTIWDVFVALILGDWGWFVLEAAPHADKACLGSVGGYLECKVNSGILSVLWLSMFLWGYPETVPEHEDRSVLKWMHWIGKLTGWFCWVPPVLYMFLDTHSYKTWNYSRVLNRCACLRSYGIYTYSNWFLFLLKQWEAE